MHEECRWSIDAARASGRSSRSTNTDGCSVRPRPTGARSSDRRDAERLELVGGPDAGAQQDRGAVDGAGAEDDLAAGDPLLAGGRPHHDVRGAAALDHDAVDERAADDRQVRAAPRGLEIAVGGRHAAVRPGVDGIRRDAGRSGCVVVVGPRLAQIGRGLREGTVDGAPLLHRQSPDRDRSAAAVVRRVAEVEVVLQAHVRGQHVGPRPARAAERRPPVEVVGQGADREL